MAVGTVVSEVTYLSPVVILAWFPVGARQVLEHIRGVNIGNLSELHRFLWVDPKGLRMA
jgi:hypothetical protein